MGIALAFPHEVIFTAPDQHASGKKISLTLTYEGDSPVSPKSNPVLILTLERLKVNCGPSGSKPAEFNLSYNSPQSTELVYVKDKMHWAISRSPIYVQDMIANGFMTDRCEISNVGPQWIYDEPRNIGELQLWIYSDPLDKDFYAILDLNLSGIDYSVEGELAPTRKKYMWRFPKNKSFTASKPFNDTSDSK